MVERLVSLKMNCSQFCHTSVRDNRAKFFGCVFVILQAIRLLLLSNVF